MRAESATPSSTSSASSSCARKASAEGDEPLLVVVVDEEQRADLGVAYGERGGQGQDAVADVLVATAAERLEAALVAHVVAAVVEHSEVMAVAPQPLRARAEHRADLEHRAGVLTRDAQPVLDAERPAPQAPLKALRRAEPAQQLGQMAYRERIVGNRFEGIGDEVAGRHERRQAAELRLHGRDAAPLIRAVEDVVDDQRHVVHQLDREHELDGLGGRRLEERPVTRQQRERSEVLRRSGQRPRERLAQLVVDALEPGRDSLAQPADLGRRAELGDHVVARDGAGGHGLTR